MVRDTYKYGDKKISAALLNSAARLINTWPTGAGAKTPLSRAGIIVVENNSGQNCAIFDILGLGGGVAIPHTLPAIPEDPPNAAVPEFDNINAYTNNPVFLGETPAAEHTGRFCVLLQPLEPGEFGDAVVLGMTFCLVRCTDPADTFADVLLGSRRKLVSGTSGSARILDWTADDYSVGEEVRALVLLTGADSCLWVEIPVIGS